ncbi:glycosyltransferase [Clostridium beijerinckii]|uniref:Glycosyltransferase involved in cell wall biosynthesis n=1 Tax=Clostridium beijerinckii TaxID=1520 RepID=A0AAX0B886_CLOBE|nr:glycosyltransferase [Clostridium beijerinckii]NRT90798.1 glycosyltransferase involved in cell wall biosynthesis [Clostridium beijerinckii]NYC70323.1 glycosyltransferase involved in cell wall biosynthesis [Clostridium beijerinckii]
MTIVQVLDALDFGDGVSKDVINKYSLLKEMGYETEIYSKWVHENVKEYRKDIRNLRLKSNDILIHHFSGECHSLDEILSQNCKKVLVYHNITPEKFFEEDSNSNHCSIGETQLKQIYKNYDFFLADSQFNADSLYNLGVDKQVDVLPILIEFKAFDHYIQNKILSKKEKLFLFVGRVAENKKHEDIIDIFEYYYSNIDCNSKLVFVGNTEYSKEYHMNLLDKISKLKAKENIIFTGKVDDSIVYNYYANADVFICMSEHEGFCIPLLESMYCGVPTLAYDSSAIGSTMGDSGILVYKKDYKKIAKLIHVILENEKINKSIVDAQLKWVDKFKKENIRNEIVILIKKWSGVN